MILLLDEPFEAVKRQKRKIGARAAFRHNSVQIHSRDRRISNVFFSPHTTEQNQGREVTGKANGSSVGRASDRQRTRENKTTQIAPVYEMLRGKPPSSSCFLCSPHGACRECGASLRSFMERGQNGASPAAIGVDGGPFEIVSKVGRKWPKFGLQEICPTATPRW